MVSLVRKSAGLGVLAFLLITSGAEGVVTIGSNLGRAPNISATCGPGCTSVQTSLPSAAQAPGGLTSQVNGTVVSWSVRSGPGSTDSVALRVVRPFPGGTFLGSGTSAAQTPPAGLTTSYTTNLPIAIGDGIGLNWGATSGNHLISAGGNDVRWGPVLVDGGTPSTPNFTDTNEVAVNATIQPSATVPVDALAPKKRGKVKIEVTAPNAGLLTAGAKKRLKSSSAQLSAPGQVSLTLAPTKAARRKLAVKKKLKAALMLVFTPTGGTAATQTLKLKLKR